MILRGFAALTACVLVPAATPVLSQPYHVLTASDLPPPNNEAAAGNPLKGFVTSPLWTDPVDQKTDIPSSLEFFYVGLDTTMMDYKTFDWTHLNTLLDDSASRNRHAILRFVLDYPDEANYVPQFLVDDGLELQTYTDFGGGDSPDYGSPLLMDALQQFIQAFGDEFDGDSRIGFIQAGLLGFWGEWHTYPHSDWITDEAKDSVVLWFQNSFRITPIQTRYPWPAAVSAGFGQHDDSFTYETLSNTLDWFFWRQVEIAQYTDFWQGNIMGGEVYPDLQEIIFSDSFPDVNDEYQQDFNLCVDTTHATYMINHHAFAPSLGYTGSDLDRAKIASSRLGYSFLVTRVEVSTAAQELVDIAVEISQTGVAPFYYPLSLTLSCDGSDTRTLNGVETILVEGDSKTFFFVGISPTPECLGSVSLKLHSMQAYSGNQVKFAQGPRGTVELNLPSPSANPPAAFLESLVVSINDQWATVALTETYKSPIAVCSVRYKGTDMIPTVVRMRNASSQSIDIRLQNPSGMSVPTRKVHCVIVEEGSWSLPDGRKIEARSFTSTTTDYKGSWVGEPQTYNSSYVKPIVLGQVMTANDMDWSVFWCRGSSRKQRPTATSFFAGKHVGEDTDKTRDAETVGYVVIEAGHSVNGADVEYEAALSADSVRGYGNRASYRVQYTTPFSDAKPKVTIVTQAAMDGNDGGWAVSSGAQSQKSLSCVVDEDQISNSERKHTTEQLAYLVLSKPGSIALIHRGFKKTVTSW